MGMLNDTSPNRSSRELIVSSTDDVSMAALLQNGMASGEGMGTVTPAAAMDSSMLNDTPQIIICCVYRSHYMAAFAREA
jgi:hypothetical protein